MKKIFTPLLISTILLMTGATFGQVNSIDYGIRGNDCDQLIVEWNSSYNFGAGEDQWTQASFTITWDQSLGGSVLGTLTSLLPGFPVGSSGWQYSGTATLVGTEYRQDIILLSGGYNQQIPTGITEVLAVTLNGTGSGTFNIADPNGITNISHGLYGTSIWSNTFNPSQAANVGFDDKIVWNGSEWCGGSGANYQPGAGDTKPCFITGTNGHLTQWGASVGALTVQTGGDLTIDPAASLTNTGNTTINQPQGLIIGADATGSGSFIDNGTITYGSSGSAKVQTYIVNSASAGSYYIHQIGPTVNDPAYTTAYPGEFGVFLGAFDLQSLGTYSYRYNETTNSWDNIYLTSTTVPRGLGKITSTTNGVDATLNMIGELTTAPSFISTTTSTDPNISPWVATLTPAQGNGLYMGSNPFPSGLDLAAWHTLLSGGAGIGNTMWIWDQASSTYATAVDGGFAGWTYTGVLASTSGVINPGQGFFTQFTSLTVNYLVYANSSRVHLHAPFIKNVEDVEFPTLRLALTKGNSRDEVVVKFADGATAEYDDFCDGPKWLSMIEEASEIMTLSADDYELTVNILPELEDEVVTVPLEMKAGTTGEHVLEATEILSFVPGSEVYLEDLQVGGDWIRLNDHPTYTFHAVVDDPLHRFNLHFFGPTGIDDPVAEVLPVQIYGYDHNAYIVNRGEEVIEEYVVYDMMGRELQRGTLPNTSVNKVFIGQVSAYYIVKVVTNNRIYSEKVFINR